MVANPPFYGNSISAESEVKLLVYHSTKKRQHSFHILKAFLSDTHQSMNTSDSDLKVNRKMYADAVTCDRMRLIGPKFDQLGPISIVYLKSPNERTNSFCLHKTGF